MEETLKSINTLINENRSDEVYLLIDEALKKKYYIHVFGPDDILGPYTKDDANMNANEINKNFVKRNIDEHENILCVAIVCDSEKGIKAPYKENL